MTSVSRPFSDLINLAYEETQKAYLESLEVPFFRAFMPTESVTNEDKVYEVFLMSRKDFEFLYTEDKLKRKVGWACSKCDVYTEAVFHDPHMAAMHYETHHHPCGTVDQKEV